VAAECEALLIIAAAHHLEVEATVRGRWQGETYLPHGRSRIRGPVVKLAPSEQVGGAPITEYQVAYGGQDWTFRPHEVVELKVFWILPSEADRLPPEPGKIALRCPACACIASYGTERDVVSCTNCQKQLRVPSRARAEG
jgi:hypothetical protein